MAALPSSSSPCSFRIAQPEPRRGRPLSGAEVELSSTDSMMQQQQQRHQQNPDLPMSALSSSSPLSGLPCTAPATRSSMREQWRFGLLQTACSRTASARASSSALLQSPQQSPCQPAVSLGFSLSSSPCSSSPPPFSSSLHSGCRGDSSSSSSSSSSFSSLLQPQSCHSKKRFCPTSHGKRGRVEDADCATSSLFPDAASPLPHCSSSATSVAAFQSTSACSEAVSVFFPPSLSPPLSDWALQDAAMRQQQLQLPASLSSLSLHQPRSPSPAPPLSVSPLPQATSSSPAPSCSLRSSASSPPPLSCPVMQLSRQCASLFSVLASLPLHEFKSLLCPLLPHLLASDPQLPSLLLSRFASRSRWQSMPKDLLANCFSFLSLFDLFHVAAVNHHYRHHSGQSMIFQCVAYDARCCPPIRTDRSLERLCAMMQRGRIPITRMRLTGCGITWSGLSSLVTLAPTLTSLDLSCMAQVTDCAVLHVSKLPRLSHLVLDNTSVTSASMRYLRCLPQLSSLSVAYTRVDQSGFSDLLYLPLTALAVSGVLLHESGYKQLGTFTQLRRLQLGCIPARALHRLRHITQVEEIEFACTVKAKKQTQAAQREGQSEQVHGEEGAVHAEPPVGSDDAASGCSLDLSGLGELQRLCSLNIGLGGAWDHLGMRQDAFFEPLAALPSLSRLQITCCPLLSDEHLLTLSRSSSLTSLHLEGRMSCRGMVYLAQLPALRSLHLTSSHIADAGLQTLSLLPQLCHLHLSHACITHVGMQQLALQTQRRRRQAEVESEHGRCESGGVRVLELECMKLSDGCIAAMLELSSLVDVSLTRCVISRCAEQQLTARASRVTLQGCTAVVGDLGDEPCRQRGREAELC